MAPLPTPCILSPAYPVIHPLSHQISQPSHQLSSGTNLTGLVTKPGDCNPTSTHTTPPIVRISATCVYHGTTPHTIIHLTAKESYILDAKNAKEDFYIRA